MIELGCCSFCFKGWELKRALRVVAEMGFAWASVGVNHARAQVSSIDAGERPRETGQAVRELAGRYGVRLAEAFMCPLCIDEGPGVEPNDPDESRRRKMLERFRGICTFVREAGFVNVMGVPGLWQQNMERAAAWELAMESLRSMVRIAEEQGVVFTVEPHSGSIVNEVELLERMVREVPGLRLTLDYAHFVGKAVAEELLFGLHDVTTHLHAKPARPGALKCPISENATAFARIVQDLKQRGWSGVISTECFGDPCGELLQHPAISNARMAGLIADVLR